MIDLMSVASLNVDRSKLSRSVAASAKPSGPSGDLRAWTSQTISGTIAKETDAPHRKVCIALEVS